MSKASGFSWSAASAARLARRELGAKGFAALSARRRSAHAAGRPMAVVLGLRGRRCASARLLLAIPRAIAGGRRGRARPSTKSAAGLRRLPAGGGAARRRLGPRADATRSTSEGVARTGAPPSMSGLGRGRPPPGAPGPSPRGVARRVRGDAGACAAAGSAAARSWFAVALPSLAASVAVCSPFSRPALRGAATNRQACSQPAGCDACSSRRASIALRMWMRLLHGLHDERELRFVPDQEHAFAAIRQEIQRLVWTMT